MRPAPSARIDVHATGVVSGKLGILIRGAPGAGKSLLALEMLELGTADALVGDDHLTLARTNGEIVMCGAQAWRGRIELRGLGVVERPAVAEAAVGLVVDLVDDFLRLPETHEWVTELLGVSVPRLPVPRRGIADSAHQRLLIGEMLRRVRPSGLGKSQKFT